MKILQTTVLAVALSAIGCGPVGDPASTLVDDYLSEVHTAEATVFDHRSAMVGSTNVWSHLVRVEMDHDGKVASQLDWLADDVTWLGDCTDGSGKKLDVDALGALLEPARAEVQTHMTNMIKADEDLSLAFAEEDRHQVAFPPLAQAMTDAAQALKAEGYTCPIRHFNE